MGTAIQIGQSTISKLNYAVIVSSMVAAYIPRSPYDGLFAPKPGKPLPCKTIFAAIMAATEPHSGLQEPVAFQLKPTADAFHSNYFYFFCMSPDFFKAVNPSLLLTLLSMSETVTIVLLSISMLFCGSAV